MYVLLILCVGAHGAGVSLSDCLLSTGLIVSQNSRLESFADMSLSLSLSYFGKQQRGGYHVHVCLK